MWSNLHLLTEATDAMPSPSSDSGTITLFIAVLAAAASVTVGIYQYRGTRAQATVAAQNASPSSLEGWQKLVDQLQETSNANERAAVEARAEAAAARHEAAEAYKATLECQNDHRATQAYLSRITAHLAALGIPLPSNGDTHEEGGSS